MRFAFVLPAALLATGCGVPDVSFTDAGGSAHDATPDAPMADAPEEVAVDAGSDVENDAGADAADAGDAATDAPEYCKGDAGPPMGPMYKCCGSATGTVCAGNCNGNQCTACGVCAWPSVCCPMMGDMGHCSGDDGGC
jgi:hypothetical protein